MYDPDTGKKNPSRLRAIVRLFMRLLLRWKALTRFSKAILIATIVLSVIIAAFYTHSTFASSTASSEEWRRQLGRAAWHFLHTTAAQLPDKANITATHLEAFRSIFRSLEAIYPCDECREHLVQNMKRMRSLDDVVDAPSALVWTCELHNIVNEAQRKPIFPCDPQILANRWANPNCGCRSKKSNDAASSQDTAVQFVKNDAPVARPTPVAASAKSPQAKADAIVRAQARVVSDAAATMKPPPGPDVKQDSATQREQDANAESAPDTVVLPDGEET